MAIETEPTEKLDWATAQPANGTHTAVPDTSAQLNGWPPAPATPVRTWFNYWMRAVWVWVRYVLRTTARTGTFTSTDGETPTFATQPTGVYAYRNTSGSPYPALVLRAVDGTAGGQLAIEAGTTGALIKSTSPSGANTWTIPGREATQAEAEAGSAGGSSGVMTPQRVRQAVARNSVASAGTNAHGGGWRVMGAGNVGGVPHVVVEEWGYTTITIPDGESFETESVSLSPSASSANNGQAGSILSEITTRVGLVAAGVIVLEVSRATTAGALQAPVYWSVRGIVPAP